MKYQEYTEDMWPYNIACRITRQEGYATAEDIGVGGTGYADIFLPETRLCIAQIDLWINQMYIHGEQYKDDMLALGGKIDKELKKNPNYHGEMRAELASRKPALVQGGLLEEVKKAWNSLLS